MRVCSQEDSVTTHSDFIDRSFLYCALFFLFITSKCFTSNLRMFSFYFRQYKATLSVTGVVSSRSTALQQLSS